MSKTTTSSLYRRLHGIFSTPKTTKPTTTTKSSSNVHKRERRLQKLVENFKKSSESEQFRARYDYYTTAVRRLVSAKKSSLIEEILEDQKKYPDITTENFAIRLISLYGKAGMLDHAHKLFDEMPELKCERTVKSFNALLSACVNARKFERAYGMLREMPEKLGMKPDCVSYNTVIKAYCEMGSLDSALLVLVEMEKNGLEPDTITFNTLMEGFYGNGRYSDGETIWALMESKNVEPNVRSYNSRLRGLVFVKKPLEGAELVAEMESKGIKPDVYSYNALIDGFVDAGNLEETKRWFNVLRENKCVPDRHTFITLVPFLCEKGDLDMAVKLCKKAIQRRVLTNATMVQSVLDGLVKESRTEEAMELVKLGKSNKYFHYKLNFPSNK